MKKILKILVSLIIVGAFGFFLYRNQDSIRAGISPLLNTVTIKIGIIASPCKNPIVYSLGAFDTKFGITRTYFLSALSEAEAIWEKPAGKELFAYNSDGALKVNLVYDYRQVATSKLAGLGIVVSDNRASYDTLKIKFTELKTKLTAAKKDYDAQVLSFNERQKIYEQQVEFWNDQGGAPRKEFNELQAQKFVLDTQLSQLQAKQAQINEMVTEINAVVVVLNRLAGILNISVDAYNETGASRGESFEEGVYQSDGIKSEIDIYEFSSRAKLVRVLAHELGHALGLPHVDDPKAIMYKLNQSSNIIPTKDDLAALDTECGVE